MSPTYPPSAKHHRVGRSFRHMGGWQRDLPDHRDMLFSALHVTTPSAADNTHLVTRIEDQGNLGSCQSNAATSALESAVKRAGGVEPELSRLFVYYYVRKLEGTLPTQDVGASIRMTMKVITTIGAPREDEWPYLVEQFSVAPSYRAWRDAQRHRVARYFRCPSLLSVKAAIADGGTVAGGFRVPESMLSVECESTGMVSLPKADEGFIGGHAVHFVAYDDAAGYVKFQNSWGDAWGRAGFGLLPYSFWEQGLATDCWTVRSGS